MKIKFLITGGTIDDLEYSASEEAPENHKTLIPDLLKQGRASFDYEVEILMQKDSKFVNDEDRELFTQKCLSSEEDRIVITHGTMTMPETARYLGERIQDKTIVLLGAAVPANKENSDALFNLGAAVMAAQTLPSGVYVVMNGVVFDSDNVKKNFETGYFEESK